MKNIILCGFMGCGKSTVGKALAESLGFSFIDTDEEIVKRQGITIAEIFKSRGEPYFRKLETELVKELKSSYGKVIALGGGLAANRENHPYLKECGRVVLLECDIETTLKRISGDKSRPLTFGGREDIINRYNLRRPIYQEVADTVIDSSGEPADTLRKILTALEENK